MAGETDAAPYLTCIVYAFDAAQSLAFTLDSLLTQTFTDFEALIIDDGADEATRAVLSSYADSRIQIVRQAHDGVSAARNRGLSLARGAYVCFLDAGQTRPVWSFASAVALMQAHRPDAVFCAGVDCDARGEIQPSVDAAIVETLVQRANSQFAHAADVGFGPLLPLLMLLEPRAVNTFVSRALVNRAALTFPNGHNFQDWLFHSAVVASLQSFCLLPSPSFTCHQMGGPKRKLDDAVFDSIAVAKLSLECFASSPRNSDVLLRGAVLASAFRRLKSCQESASHLYRAAFHEALIYLVNALPEDYFLALPEFERSGLPYAGASPFLEKLRKEAGARRASKTSGPHDV